MASIILASEPHCVEEAVALLGQGKLVCYPTDTVYGLGARAGSDEAVRRLYAVKGRSPDKPLPLLISDPAEATRVADVSPLARSLMSRFWPGALTIVMPKAPAFRSQALAGRDTIALRVPDHALVREILRLVGEPVTGTSANRASAAPPVSAAEAAFGLGDAVELVIDGGRSASRVESTVVDVSEGGVRLLREGAVSREEIEAAGQEVRG